MEVEQYKNNEVALHEQLAKLVTHAEKSMADKTALEKVVSLWNCHIRIKLIIRDLINYMHLLFTMLIVL